MAQAAGVAGANTGLYVNCFNASANYGVRIINPPAGANNWAIYSDATAQSYFAGNVGIGTTGPTANLHVASASDATMRLSRTSGATLDFLTTASAGFVNVSSNHNLVLRTNNTDRVFVDTSGNVGIGTTGPTISSGVGLHLAGSTLRLGTARTPASSTATGNQGEVCWDSSYLYVCIATNTWRRIALTTW
jgi:hypothetical protein